MKLIFDHHRRMYWRANEKGFATNRVDAGRYTDLEAQAIVESLPERKFTLEDADQPGNPVVLDDERRRLAWQMDQARQFHDRHCDLRGVRTIAHLLKQIDVVLGASPPITTSTAKRKLTDGDVTLARDHLRRFWHEHGSFSLLAQPSDDDFDDLVLFVACSFMMSGVFGTAPAVAAPAHVQAVGA